MTDVNDIYQYLEPCNLCEIELLEKEMFDHLTMCKQMFDV